MVNPETACLPIVLVAGLNCSARLYGEQLPLMWQFGPVTIADHRRDDTIAAIAGRVLAAAAPRFALAGLSMGGYIAFEMVRQAPERVMKLALLDTGAGAETADRTAARQPLLELAQSGRFAEITDLQFPFLVHRSRHHDAALKAIVRAMNAETGAEAYLRQQRAIISRPDSRPHLAAIACRTLVVVGDDDQLTPPDLAREMASAIPRARLAVIAECGHLSTVERPQAVNKALAEWLSS